MLCAELARPVSPAQLTQASRPYAKGSEGTHGTSTQILQSSQKALPPYFSCGPYSSNILQRNTQTKQNNVINIHFIVIIRSNPFQKIFFIYFLKQNPNFKHLTKKELKMPSNNSEGRCPFSQTGKKKWSTQSNTCKWPSLHSSPISPWADHLLQYHNYVSNLLPTNPPVPLPSQTQTKWKPDRDMYTPPPQKPSTPQKSEPSYSVNEILFTFVSTSNVLYSIG